jgi:hypothetical protein
VLAASEELVAVPELWLALVGGPAVEGVHGEALAFGVEGVVAPVGDAVVDIIFYFIS